MFCTICCRVGGTTFDWPLQSALGAMKDATNQKLEALVAKAGVPKRVLNDPDQIVCDDVWTDERARLAQEHLQQDKSTISEFWQSK